MLGLNETPGAYIPFEQYLEQQLERDVDILTYQSGNQVTEAIRAGELDFAIVTPVGFISSDREMLLRPILTLNTDVSPDFDFMPVVSSAVFVLEDRQDINAYQDIKGKSIIGLADDSIGGWLGAKREWHLLGIKDEDFSSITMLENNQQILQSVCTSQSDIGVMSAITFSQLRESCDTPLRILADPSGITDERYPLEKSSRFYPAAPLVAVGRLSEHLISDMSVALQAIEPGDKIFEGLGISRFTPPLSFLTVRELMVDLELGPYVGINDVSVALMLENFLEWIVAALLVFCSVLGVYYVRTVRLLKKLQVSEGFRKRVFEESHLPIVILKGETLEYLIVNKAACPMYGVESATDILGKTPLDFSPSVQANNVSSTEQAMVHVEQAKNSGLQIFNWVHVRPNGEEWTASIHLMPFYSDGELFFQVTQEDITEQLEKENERKLLEKELQHSQRMDSVGRLAGAISHDFNNLLTVINGYCDILIVDHESGTETSEQKYIRQIALAGQQAAELTGQLLTFSRKQASNPLTLNLATVLNESLTMIGNLIGEDIKVVNLIKTDTGLVTFDPGQINQVLMNLFVNSRDAMPEGGVLTISLNEHQLDESEAFALDLQAGEFVLLTVSDTGSGITDQTGQHIFEPFFSTKGDKGNGLGLSTVYGIIKQHGGAITFSSESEVGTSFYIYLPVASAQEHDRSSENKQKTDLSESEAVVLLVEDQESVRELSKSVLHANGFEVIAVNNAEEALLVAADRDIDIQLLFSDVVLEGMNGGELADQLCNIRPNVPVLLMSGYSEDEISRRGVEQEKYPFIAKPFSPKELLVKVKQVLKESSLANSKTSLARLGIRDSG